MRAVNIIAPSHPVQGTIAAVCGGCGKIVRDVVLSEKLDNGEHRLDVEVEGAAHAYLNNMPARGTAGLRWISRVRNEAGRPLPAVDVSKGWRLFVELRLGSQLGSQSRPRSEGEDIRSWRR